jgi:excisionase family DNA binding protein
VTHGDKQLLSIREVSKLLGVSMYVAYDLARKGRLPGLVRLGERRVYVRRAVLERWLQGKDNGQKDEVEIWP